MRSSWHSCDEKQYFIMIMIFLLNRSNRFTLSLFILLFPSIPPEIKSYKTTPFHRFFSFCFVILLPNRKGPQQSVYFSPQSDGNKNNLVYFSHVLFKSFWDHCTYVKMQTMLKWDECFGWGKNKTKVKENQPDSRWWWCIRSEKGKH